MSVADVLEEIRRSNVTNIIHLEPYEAISPTRAELTQAGRSVLITGGGTGVGFSIAQAFIRASVATIIIIGRRTEVLNSARLRLEEEAKAMGASAKIIAKSCDVTSTTEVDRLWDDLKDQGIFVDVYVANAAKFTEVQTMLELGTDEVWNQVETNVRSPLHFAERFWKQPGEKQKFIVNISTGSIHAHHHPAVAVRPAYTLSKLSGTLLFQLLAQDHTHERMQIVSFNPGLIYNDYWKSLGLGQELFQSEELCGAFAVWAASKEAAFLHGRFVWCSWDVEELASGVLRTRLDQDPDFLRASIVGLKGGALA